MKNSWPILNLGKMELMLIGRGKPFENLAAVMLFLVEGVRPQRCVFFKLLIKHEHFLPDVDSSICEQCSVISGCVEPVDLGYLCLKVWTALTKCFKGSDGRMYMPFEAFQNISKVADTFGNNSFLNEVLFIGYTFMKIAWGRGEIRLVPLPSLLDLGHPH